MNASKSFPSVLHLVTLNLLVKPPESQRSVSENNFDCTVIRKIMFLLIKVFRSLKYSEVKRTQFMKAVLYIMYKMLSLMMCISNAFYKIPTLVHNEMNVFHYVRSISSAKTIVNVMSMWMPAVRNNMNTVKNVVIFEI